MAEKKISELPAVATPAGTDEFAVNQGGTSKRMTLTQLAAAGVPGAFTTLAATADVSVGADADAATRSVILNTAAAQVRRLKFQSAGVDRWIARTNATAEGGSNAGSDFELLARDDAGAAIGVALEILRADMAATFGATLSVTDELGVGGDPTTDAGLSVLNTALAGTTQMGADVAPVSTSAATVAGYGVRARIETPASAFTMAAAAALIARNAVKGAGSTITNLYGLYVEDQTVGASNWAIYTAGTAKSYFGGEVEIDGALNHDGTSFGLAGAAPSTPQTGYTTFTNLATDRTCDADTVAVAELADIVGTLIEDLKAKGIISA